MPFCLLGDSNRQTLFPWSPRVPFVRSRRREAGRARDYPRESRVSAGRAPSPPSSTFAARGAALHGQHPRFSFSMISPSNFVEERAPRLSAMGGRAGCNPDNPLELTTKCRLLAARGSKNARSKEWGGHYRAPISMSGIWSLVCNIMSVKKWVIDCSFARATSVQMSVNAAA